MRALLAVVLLAAPLCPAAPFAHAQDNLPRTADGRPDLHGYWLTGFVTQLERIDGFTALVIPPGERDAAIKRMVDYISEGEVYDPEFDTNTVPFAPLSIDGEMRSSLIVSPEDGRLPLTALAKAGLDRFRRGYDNPEARPLVERCVEGGVSAPMSASFLLMPVQVVQTPAHVALVMEDVDPVRIAAFDAPPRPDALRTRNGQSRARWEGDTLVIETDRFAIAAPEGFSFRGGGALITADSRVTERFRLTAPDTLLYQYTIADPSLYSAPWLAEYTFTRIPRPVYEYACHEGNHSLIHILTAARLGKQEAPAQ